MLSRFLTLSNSNDSTVFVTSSAKLNERLREFLPLFMEDFVMSWYRQFISDDYEFPLLVEETVAALTKSLEKRLIDMDWTEIIMVNVPDLLNSHLDNYRKSVTLAASLSSSSSIEEAFASLDSHPCCNQEKEDLYLRRLSEVIVSLIMPKRELLSLETRIVLEDLVAFSVLKALLDSLSEPSTIIGLIATSLQASIAYPSVEAPKKSAPASSYLSIISRILNPFQLIKSTVRSIFNFLAPSRVKLLFREIHWILLLDNVLHFSPRNPIFTHTLVFFVRPILYFFWGDAIQTYLRDIVKWLFSPQRLIYYLDILQSTYWPEGKFHMEAPFTETEATKKLSEYRTIIMSVLKTRYPHILSGATELLDMLQYKSLNKTLLCHALDLLVRNIFPELNDEQNLTKLFKNIHDSETSGLPSPSSNRARSRFYRKKGLPTIKTCFHHPNVSISVEEDFISCQQCHEVFCRLLCPRNLICRLHNASADSCQCYRGPFICKKCFTK